MNTPDKDELLDWLALLERMVAEGCRDTERWVGSSCLGIGPLLVMLWEVKFPHAAGAWPTRLIACMAIGGAGIRVRQRKRPSGMRWRYARRPDRAGALRANFASQPKFFAALFALPAAAHGASGAILR